LPFNLSQIGQKPLQSFDGTGIQLALTKPVRGEADCGRQRPHVSLVPNPVG
jgi:hypothetical protein